MVDSSHSVYFRWIGIGRALQFVSQFLLPLLIIQSLQERFVMLIFCDGEVNDTGLVATEKQVTQFIAIAKVVYSVHGNPCCGTLLRSLVLVRYWGFLNASMLPSSSHYYKTQIHEIPIKSAAGHPDFSRRSQHWQRTNKRSYENSKHTTRCAKIGRIQLTYLWNFARFS